YQDVDAWIIESHTGHFTNRTPGLIAITAVGYLVASPWVTGFVVWPATLIAVLSAAGAGVLAVAASRSGKNWIPWVAGAVVIGLGTALWGVASDQIWPHGPAALFLAAAVLAISRDRLVLSGFAFGAALLVRPTVAVLAAVVGLGLSLVRREWKPALSIGLPSMTGAILLTLYNLWMLGSWSPTALYDAQGGLTARPGSLVEWTKALFAPSNGVLVWSSWILIALVVILLRKEKSADWAKPVLWGSFAYVVVHSAMNRVSGGLPYDYRYQIEAVVMAGPLLIAALWSVRGERWYRIPAIVGVVASVGLQFAFVSLSSCVEVAPGILKCHLFGS
ncbi:MAG: hypothetical protein PVF87_13630, partial [Acidimicrobiia bacterium]